MYLTYAREGYYCAMPSPDVNSPSGLVARIETMLPNLRPAERRVAEAVLTDPAAVARESISALAERCGVSAPTVVRFSKRVGLAGYPQLRVGLAMAAGAEAGRTGRPMTAGIVGEDDSLCDIAAKVAHAHANSIEETLSALDLNALKSAVRTLSSAEKIDVVGIAGSGLIGADLVHKLQRFGYNAWVQADRHAAVTALALRGRGDVVVGISHTGHTADVVEPLRMAASRGVKVVAITSDDQSPLGLLADTVLTYRSKEPAFRLGAMASRIAQLSVIDFLLGGIAMRQAQPVRSALDSTFKAVGAL
ncbi:MurR/RpiR family transcriptional regulator [Tessaracoccus sp. Y36]